MVVKKPHPITLLKTDLLPWSFRTAISRNTLLLQQVFFSFSSHEFVGLYISIIMHKVSSKINLTQ